MISQSLKKKYCPICLCKKCDKDKYCKQHSCNICGNVDCYNVIECPYAEGSKKE